MSVLPNGFFEGHMREYDEEGPDMFQVIQANNDIKARLAEHAEDLRTGRAAQKALEHRQAEEKRKQQIVIAGRPAGWGDFA